MQKTTRLVVLQIFVVAVFFLAPTLVRPAAHSASAQAPRVSPQSESWGDRELPENYVKSKEPAKSKSAYNWVQMGYASLVMLAMVGFVVYLVRRNTREGAPDLGQKPSGR